MNKQLASALMLSVASLFVAACGGSEAEPATPATAEGGDQAAPAGGARPSCEAIDVACDKHEDKPGTPHECHELAEAAATTEEQCAAKKTECLAACP